MIFTIRIWVSFKKNEKAEVLEGSGARYASGLSKIKIKLEQILTSHQR
jgi:hypothetical protein